MANDLTGDFDAVAQFSILAANRVLAAMHRCERFPHSMTLRVDDIPPRGFPVRPVLVGVVDGFGSAVANQTQVGKPNPWPGLLAATDAVYSGLRPVVNVGNAVPPITPSNFQGVAQLQLAPPTIEVPDASGANLAVRMRVMSRYFPDPHTAPAAEFVRGDLLVTAAVNQVASQAGNIIAVNVDTSGDNVIVSFVQQYASSALSAEDLAGINLLIRNGLKTSFLPSNATLPDAVKFLQFKTLLTPLTAIAVLLNLSDTQGNPATVNNGFLSNVDDFGFAVGSDFLVQQFKKDLAFQPPSLSFMSYTISVNAPTIELQTGRILLRITGHAHSSVLPDFNFTLTQAFTLNLASTVPGGPLDTAELAISGDISVDVTGLTILFDWLADDFVSWSLGPVRAQRDAVVQAHQQDVRDTFSANKILGSFLNTLLNPSLPPTNGAPPQNVNFVLAYTSVDIQPSGIILHGSLSVTPGPAPHVEYQPIPPKAVGPLGGIIVPRGPDYSALNTWIPGGTITEYDWSYQNQNQPFLTDDKRFVLLASGPTIAERAVFAGTVPGLEPGYTPLCLTIKGTRLSSSGPVVPQPVTASVCGYNSFPVVNGLNPAVNGTSAMIALTQPGPSGTVQVVGHTPAQAHVDPTGCGTPYVVAYFAKTSAKTSPNLDFLVQALSESGRKDARVAVLALLTPDQMAKARYTPGIIYGNSDGGAWERVFGLTAAQNSRTVIITPTRKVAWQHEGAIDSETLAAALKHELVAGGSVRRGLLGSYLCVGRQVPDFRFELAPGHFLTLRKLLGRSVILIFWCSSSRPSIDAVRDVQDTVGKAGRQGPVVLAINGEDDDLARKVAAENGLTATLVTDPARMIWVAYGVSICPTMVFLDKTGVATGIRYGRIVSDSGPSQSGLTPSALVRKRRDLGRFRRTDATEQP
jgi:peroxiredoxin